MNGGRLEAAADAPVIPDAPADPDVPFTDDVTVEIEWEWLSLPLKEW